MDNVYYNPEKFDLEIIDELELGGEYDFDTHVVFKDKQGWLYYCHDSGCSCPCPFEDFSGVQDMERITKEYFEIFSSTIMSLKQVSISERIKFLDNVKKYL